MTKQQGILNTLANTLRQIRLVSKDDEAIELTEKALQRYQDYLNNIHN